MISKLSHVNLWVLDKDDAIAFYRDVLGFELVEDTPLANKRWVRMRAGGGSELLLSRAVGDQAAAVGKQAGGRVFLFLHTQTFDADVARIRPRVQIAEERTEPYGRVVVFPDLYGNRIDLIERA